MREGRLKDGLVGRSYHSWLLCVEKLAMREGSLKVSSFHFFSGYS
jgi:hypothetical protein